MILSKCCMNASIIIIITKKFVLIWILTSKINEIFLDFLVFFLLFFVLVYLKTNEHVNEIRVFSLIRWMKKIYWLCWNSWLSDFLKKFRIININNVFNNFYYYCKWCVHIYNSLKLFCFSNIFMYLIWYLIWKKINCLWFDCQQI